MTQEEAVQAMREGKKVTHTYFFPNEWATIQDERVVLEDDSSCSISEFYRWRTDPFWLTGWSIYKETK